MEKINGIIVDGRFYQAIAATTCEQCAFDNDKLNCDLFSDFCNYHDCAFRYSPELTDKINGK